MKVTDFLEFRDKCRYIITEVRHTYNISMNFCIDDIAILDIIGLDANIVVRGHIKYHSSRRTKALQKYNTSEVVRIDYLIHGSSNIHYDFVPAKYLLPEYSEEDIKKDLQKRLKIAGMDISDVEEVYALMTVDTGELC